MHQPEDKRVFGALSGSSIASFSIGDVRADIDGAGRHLNEGIEQITREIAQARESAERLRLIPASRMFLSLERAARDAALNLGKQIEFEARGGGVRLDGLVFSAMQAALVQAVRNAVAHGIETPELRAAAGEGARASDQPCDAAAARGARRRCRRGHPRLHRDGGSPGPRAQGRRHLMLVSR